MITKRGRGASCAVRSKARSYLLFCPIMIPPWNASFHRSNKRYLYNRAIKTDGSAKSEYLCCPGFELFCMDFVLGGVTANLT